MFGFMITAAILLAVFYGYFANIYYLVTNQGPTNGLTIARAIGIIVGPLGIILGYISNPEPPPIIIESKGDNNEA